MLLQPLYMELDIISQIRTNDTVMEFSDIPPLDRADIAPVSKHPFDSK